MSRYGLVFLFLFLFLWIITSCCSVLLQKEATKQRCTTGMLAIEGGKGRVGSAIKA